MVRIRKEVFLILAVIFFVTGCASNKEEPPRELEAQQKTSVIEHKGTALGINDIPSWVDVYITQGIPGLEKMPEFADMYCFVGENTGTNRNSLQLWGNGFNIPQEIARTVSSRVKALFTGAATGSPESAYGSYFENVVKSTADATYSGARKLNDWWVYVRYYNDDGKTRMKDEYRAFVLTTIPKVQLDQQVMDVINGVSSAGTTPEQMTAVDRVKSIMAAEGF